MSFTIYHNGRLGNQIFRNVAMSIVAKKHNLYVDYSNSNLITELLGIDLFIGLNQYEGTKILTDHNYFEILNLNSIDYNLNPNQDFFQSKEISDLTYKYINSFKNNIILKNPFKERYENNNDLVVHIRLTDAFKMNVGLEYYLKLINKIEYNTLYIATDEINHSFISEIKSLCKNVEILEYDEIKTFQFASTCKNIILSHGSFSAIIGYLGFFSKIYYPDYRMAVGGIWNGDIFSQEGWEKISNN